MSVSTTALPAGSRLALLRKPGDFLDCYAVPSNLDPRRAAEIIVTFPGWARLLLELRRIVTAPFGLSQDGPDAADKLGPFPVEHADAEEIVAGFDDRHLNFRVSVLSREGRVHLATWVDPHNWGGRLYLTLILPFHIAIARNALARVARAG
ncbi:DUF2867 domain-containing protein [Jannaschia sp. M317]|nr:DUF2867 domain-containing protein [Jannaschia sp. M317]